MNIVLEQFERTVSRVPDRTAVSDPDEQVSYRQLREAARRVGSGLCRYTAGMNAPVVISTANKTWRTLAAVYGVMYSGGFYVFISPEQPAERIRKMMEELLPAAVLADEEEAETFRKLSCACPVLSLRELLHAETEEQLLQQAWRAGQDSDLLYAVYTSGSTGVPKGVAVSRDAVCRFIHHFVSTFGISGDDVIGNQAPFDFDVSVKDIFSACFTGAELVLIPRAYFSMPARLLDYLEERRVSVLIWAVSAMCMISGLRGFAYRIPSHLRLVMFSGEVMPPRQLRIWQIALPGCSFVNLYGPSEITCNCTYFRITRQYDDTERIPIGRPFDGRMVSLLGEGETRIESSGQIGEICVAGESLAEGYYHNPEKTTEVFSDFSWQGRTVRIYHTGDLGSFGEDGELYFEGRRDAQIKLMGHRIELGEVERAMMGVDGVDRACCLFDQEKHRIFGFYTGQIAEGVLRTRIKDIIPAYMIPSRLIALEAFGLNKNGKIDRQRLRRLMAETR